MVVFISFYWIKVSQLRFIFLFCLLILQYAETLIRYIVTYYATYIYIYMSVCVCVHAPNAHCNH